MNTKSKTRRIKSPELLEPSIPNGKAKRPAPLKVQIYFGIAFAGGEEVQYAEGDSGLFEAACEDAVQWLQDDYDRSRSYFTKSVYKRIVSGPYDTFVSSQCIARTYVINRQHASSGMLMSDAIIDGSLGVYVLPDAWYNTLA